MGTIQLENMEKYNKKDKIIHKIDQTKRTELVSITLTNFVYAASVSGMAAIVFIALESLLNSGVTTRTAFVGTWAVITLFVFVLAVLPTLRYWRDNSKSGVESIAFRVGEVYPDIKDTLSNAIQLRYRNNTADIFSNELIMASYSEAVRKSESKDFSVIIDKKSRKKAILLFLSVIAISTLSFFAIGKDSQSALNRLVNYNQSFVPAAPFSLSISPKSAEIERGDSINIKVSYSGKLNQKVLLYIKYENDTDFEKIELNNKTSDSYNYKFNALKYNVQCFAMAEWFDAPVLTDTCKIRIYERPYVKSFEGSVVYPSYTGKSRVYFNQESGDISALTGSNIELTATTAKPIKNAKVEWISNALKDSATTKDTTYYEMVTRENTATVNFKLRNSGTYKILVEDEDGFKNSNPIEYTALALNDEYPAITLLQPISDIRIGDSGLLPIKVDISDDYGFSSLLLKYKRIESRYTEPDVDFSTLKIEIPKRENMQNVFYVWNLHDLNISPEDKYEYFLEIADNDIISGPKKAQTIHLTVKLPSLMEAMQDAENEQKQIEEELKKVLAETQKVQKEMEEFDRKVLKNKDKKELNWEDKKKLEKIADKKKEINDKLENIQDRLQKATDEMQKSNMLSEETMQKYMQLQDLMSKIDNQEFRQMQQNLQEALKQMDKNQIQKAMENFEFNEEQFKDNIERTMKMLKRMQAEQKTDAIKKQAEKMAKQQEELSKELEKANKEQAKELAKKQEQLAKDMERLQEELKKLEELMEQYQDEMPLEELKQAMDELNAEQTKQEMMQAASQMQQNQKSSAQKNQKSAQNKMQKLSKSMQQMKEQLQQQDNQEAMRQLEKSISDMIEISKNQEEIAKQTANADYNSKKIPEIASKQEKNSQALINVAANLSKLGEKSFSVTPEMGRELGNSMQQMSESISQLAERRTHFAKKAQSTAMTSLNSAIAQMQDMLGQMKQNGGSCNNPGGSGEGSMPKPGGMGFQQQLQQIAAEQQVINQSLKQMMQQGGSRMSPQQQAQHQRLSDKQGQAAEQMHKLADEQKQFGNKGERKTVGDLNKLSKEMEEVVKDMQSGKIDQETINKQDKILSRLLDATRSINDRDFEKQRESKEGSSRLLVSPSEIDLKTQEGKSRLFREILRASKNTYTKDYQAIIQKYFKQLESKETK